MAGMLGDLTHCVEAVQRFKAWDLLLGPLELDRVYTCIFRRYSAQKSSPKPDFPPYIGVFFFFFPPEGPSLCSRNTVAQRHVKSGFRLFHPLSGSFLPFRGRFRPRTFPKLS